MKAITVLLIEDDATARKGIADYLRDVAQFVIKELDNGQAALDHLESVEEDYYSAVLLDLVLGPPLNGLPVLDKIRERYPRLPVIAFTGKDPAAGSQALERGAYRYMHKPVDPAELAATVRGLAEQDAALRNLAITIRQLLQSDMCLVWRLYRRERLFGLVAWDGIHDLDDEDKGITVDADDPATRELLAKGEPIYLSDVTDPQKAPNYRDRENAKRHGWVSLITVPLLHRGRVIGLLDSYTYKRRQFPKGQKQRVKDMLRAFANQAAEAIYNTELFRQTQALIEINRLLAGAFDLDTMLEVILTKGLELVSADAGWLYLRDFEENVLVRQIAQGIGVEKAPACLKLGEDIVGLVAQEGVAKTIDDIQAMCPYDSLPADGLRSQTAVPLRREEQTVGVLVAGSQFPSVFSEEDVSLLTSFAHLATLAVERAKLMSHLQQVSQPATRSREELAGSVVKAVYDLTGRAVSLWLLDRKGTELRIAAARGVSKDYEESAHIGMDEEALASHALKIGGVVNRADIFDPTERPAFKYKDAAIREGWQSALIVPLFTSEKQPLGTLHLYGRTKGKFSPTEVNFVTGFANQVAIAFENAQRQQSLKRLVQSGRATIEQISDESQILRQLVEQVCQLTGAHCAVIYPYDPDRRQFFNKEHVVAVGLDGEYKEVADRPRTMGLAAIVRYTGQIVVHDLDSGEIEVDLSDVPEEDLDQEKLLRIIREEKFVQREGIRAFVGISLRAAGDEGGDSQDKRFEEVGVLYLNYRRAHRFTSSELNLIQVFAQQMANLIRTARLWARLREQLTLGETLVKASRAIGEAMKRDDILKTVFREAFRFVGKATGLVISVGPDHRLRIVDSEGVLEEQKDAFHSRPAYDYEGSFGAVVSTKEMFESLDTEKDLNEGRMIDFGLPIPSRVTNIPLKCEGDVVGILVLDTVAPNEQVRNALLSLASTGGIALDRTRSREHSRQQLDSLRKIVGAIGAETDPLPIILEEAVKLFGGEYGSFSLVDSAARRLIYQARWEEGEIQVGEDIPEDKRVRNWDEGGITVHVAQTGEAYRTGNAAADSLYRESHKSTVSELAVPLKDMGGKAIGVLNLESPVPDAFSQTEEDLCQNLANVATTAIEKDRLLDTEQRLNTQLDILHQVIQEGSVKEVLDRTLEGINAILGKGTSSSIARYSEQTDSFYEYRATGPLKDYLLDVPPRPIGTGRHIVDTKEPLYLDDVHNPPPGCPTIRKESMEKGVRSFAALPLKWQEQLVGALFVNVQRSISFTGTGELQRILQLFARQAAIAIENARLYDHISQNLERRIQELEVLTEIGRTVSNLGIDEILGLVYEQAGKIMDLSDAQVQIAFYDEAKDEVTFPLAVEQDAGEIIDVVRWGRREDQSRKPDEDEVVKQFRPRPRGTRFGLTEYVIYIKKPVLLGDEFREPTTRSEDADVDTFILHLPAGGDDSREGETKKVKVWRKFGRLDRPTNSWLGVPMIVQDRVIGIISIQSLGEEPPVDKDQLAVLETVASQAAVAIENARLYQQLGEKVAELEDAQSEIADKERALVLTTVAADFVHRMNNLAGTIPNWVALIKRQLGPVSRQNERLIGYLNNIVEDAERILLEARRLKEPISKPEKVNLGGLVKSIVAQTELATAPDVEIVLECEEDLPFVRAIRSQLENAVLSIIQNAIKSISGKGRITINARQSMDLGQEMIRLEILDTGCGIPADRLDSIFELGTVYWSDGKGTGYGLWRARSIVESIGGKISVDSILGKGSTFTILLPPAEGSIPSYRSEDSQQ